MSKKKGRGANGGPVGYGNPPVEGQFKKGQKPPGSGRKKGSKNYATIIAELLEANVPVTLDGKRQKTSVKRALLLRAVAGALNGSVSDVSRVFDLMERLAPRETKDPLIVRFQNIEGDDW